MGGSKAKAKPSRVVKPPENRKKAADLENNWRRKERVEKPDDDARNTENSESESDESENEIPKVPAKRAEKRIVLDDDNEEVPPPPIPFVPLKRPETEVSKLKTSKLNSKTSNIPNKDKAYKLVSKLDDPNIIQNLKLLLYARDK